MHNENIAASREKACLLCLCNGPLASGEMMRIDVYKYPNRPGIVRTELRLGVKPHARQCRSAGGSPLLARFSLAIAYTSRARAKPGGEAGSAHQDERLYVEQGQRQCVDDRFHRQAAAEIQGDPVGER